MQIKEIVRLIDHPKKLERARQLVGRIGGLRTQFRRLRVDWPCSKERFRAGISKDPVCESDSKEPVCESDSKGPVCQSDRKDV